MKFRIVKFRTPGGHHRWIIQCKNPWNIFWRVCNRDTTPKRVSKRKLIEYYNTYTYSSLERALLAYQDILGAKQKKAELRELKRRNKLEKMSKKNEALRSFKVAVDSEGILEESVRVVLKSAGKNGK